MTPQPTKIIRSKRRTLALTITSQGEFIVRAPQRMTEERIWKFIHEKQQWIQNKLYEVRSRAAKAPTKQTRSVMEVKKIKHNAKEHFRKRLDYFASLMGLSYSKLRISSAKTRWGFCSSKNSISLNWRLYEAPAEILDYVVIHELAHIKEKNHSKKFWALVEQYCQDYTSLRKWLKVHGHTLF